MIWNDDGGGQMKFKCIYADPPWQYKVYSKKGQGRSAENHYPTMSKEDIFSLPVSEIADEDCILFLWVTFPCLLDGLEAIKQWGFKYKTLGFCWVKRCKKQTSKWFWGLGFWTRANPEICIIATKGNPKRVSKSVHSVVDTPIEYHSKKPDIVRERIVQLIGDIPRIELFAREQSNGWVCVGNEVDGMDIRDSLKQIAEL
jgi:N6-adenosine-specific RNA methylase IME4